ncbi:hypothetical protein EDB82DRAFT_476120 [Fusarium venenatum]|uniref:uncharacterized protein n=1 Tax=Fusarium venenatum TaxID=56646 RepID=UPI001DD5C52A|nr:hypothetical protein EDB82DRAFT_476120 [Fusarium venenatum]
MAYIQHLPCFYTLLSFVVEGWIEPLLDQNTEGSKPPCFHKFSLAALCAMWEVGGDEKKICDTYQQQASATTTRGPDAEPTSEELQLTRLSTELTREEQRLFMDAAFNFESYCLTYYRGKRLLCYHNSARYLNIPWDNTKTFFHRYRSNLIHIFVSAVARRLKSIHGNVRQRWSWDSGSDEKYFLYYFQKAYMYHELRQCMGYLTSQGLSMFTRLHRMSHKELAIFIVRTFWHFSKITTGNRFYDPWHLESKEWVYFSSELPPKLRNIGQNIWEDMWNREDPRRRPNHNMMPYRVNPSDEGQ